MNIHLNPTHYPRILIVEDEALIRMAVCEFLEGFGFRLLQAYSGDDALKILERVGPRIELVFSDIRMPGAVDGFGVLEWLHKHQPQTPVILTSGDTGVKDGPCLTRGELFLPKPYDLDDLSIRIRALITAGTTLH